ncbi:adenylyl-sulfate kinase [Denitratimonas sp. CY0512]|uniref:adenylyl-sulfate kinase n=1 Tax=Denitratimonas sp. CY0512 TaxID=3131940 RepID=UPI0030B674BB
MATLPDTAAPAAAGETGSLRLITCGSVDDGKSTLIGRLLHDTGSLRDDQLDALARDSQRHGHADGAIDYALLLDGLEAEREQGITIDVAYRYFATARRSFIVADCPGHAQYTRNMATGASTAQLAIVLVDASKGLLDQTRRHSGIVAMFGIRQVVLAVNKMDLVDFDRDRFEAICGQYQQLAENLGIEQVQAIPLSGLHGDNLASRSSRTAWYQGPTLLEHLETVRINTAAAPDAGFRLPVQWVNRAMPAGGRGYAGTLLAAPLATGDPVVVLPSGQRSRIAGVFDGNGAVARAVPGQALTLALQDELDISRGDVLASPDAAPEISDLFAARLLWMGDQPLLPGRPYDFQLGSSSAVAQVQIRHRIDIHSQRPLAARRLLLNEVASCHLGLDRNIAFEPFTRNRELGSFILIDRQTRATVAAGCLDHALRRASNIQWQPLDVDAAARARIKGQQPVCIWFTGLSGSGKSTLANRLERHLHAQGLHTYLLDGDNIRHGLNRDLGFTEEDRVENIRRAAEVARLMVDAGLIVLASFISPYRSERRMARELFGPGQFIEVFVDTPLDICEARDPKGLYRRARAGEIPNFTGIGAPYERPETPEVHLHLPATPLPAAVERILACLQD